ncbi:MAG: type I glutamate--ammonia ligase [Candidatus Calescibacterium sp.]|nr:type I glutamate--ammonia ligase [Candidatus Calescibacterium sp.]MDW8132194.1 type I glutamate--ammonia ligase [Candidatus Calescibacterium sp.]
MVKTQDVISILKDQKVQSIRMMFVDILGIPKGVQIPVSQAKKMLDGEILFDGSSIQGFVRIEESDMKLVPDLNTFVVADLKGYNEAFVVCDVYYPNGKRFEGDPRFVLQKVLEKSKKMGFIPMVGVEAEFFLFPMNTGKGFASAPVLEHTDSGGYFDMLYLDSAEQVKLDILKKLEEFGFEVEALHHEVAPSQHEIDFKYSDALTTADRLLLFKIIVKTIALRYGLHATFLPKPIKGINGSGLHMHQSLFKGETNSFYDNRSSNGISETMLNYIGGIFKHVKSFTAVTNPLVNSYKRLVPGYEAPVYISWGEHNRSPLIRIPAKRGNSTRIELRSPDPSCNPYLAFSVIINSGLDGINNKYQPPKPIDLNVYELDNQTMKKYKIEQLPSNLYEALIEMQKDSFIKETLGEHIYYNFINSKMKEWKDYSTEVTDWELQKYFSIY